MNPWEILEITPTDEISVIKKAYAKKLRVYHPEDDPQGFQLLREAYDWALNYAKYKQFNEEENIVLIKDINDLPKHEQISESSIDKGYDKSTYGSYNVSENTTNVNSIETPATPEQLIEELFKKTDALYKDFFERIDVGNWEELLNIDIMWRLDCKELINTKMLEFLMGHYHLPKNIWQLLNASFHWEEQESRLYFYYPEAFIEYMFKQISPNRVPRYCNFDKNINIDYEEYLNYRDGANNALSYGDLEKAEHFLSLAHQLYADDPDLICMRADYYFRIMDFKNGHALFNKAIRFNPNDIDVYFSKAQILFDLGKFKDTIKICRYILKRANNDLEVRCLLGKCYINLELWYKARKLFLGNLKIKPSDIETKICLKQVANKLREILQNHPFNMILRKKLKEIYLELGQYENIKEIKITSRDILFVLKNLMYKCLYIIGVIFLIAIGIGSGGSIFIVYILIKIIGNSNKKL